MKFENHLPSGQSKNPSECAIGPLGPSPEGSTQQLMRCVIQEERSHPAVEPEQNPVCPESSSVCCCCFQVASVVSDSVRPHKRQPTRLPCQWDSPGKNTGVGCHFLLQCMKVKSESEVTQSCPTLSNPMDCSLPVSSVHGIFQARVLEWGAIAFSEIFSIYLYLTLHIYSFFPFFSTYLLVLFSLLYSPLGTLLQLCFPVVFQLVLFLTSKYNFFYFYTLGFIYIKIYIH